jgi:PAS domain S-box-containing protein
MRQAAALRVTAMVGPAVLIVAGGVVAFISASTLATHILAAVFLVAGAAFAAYVAVTLTRELERRLERQEAMNAQMREAAAAAEAARVALTAERRFLRQVIDINPNFVFAKDRQGRFTLVNQAVADVYGTSIDHLVGKSDADFNTNEAEVEFFRRIDRQVLESGRPLLIPEERITDASGGVRWLQTVKCPIIGDSGRAEQVLGVSTDITERKRIEVALRAEGVRVRAMQRVTAGLAAAASPADVAHVVASEGATVVGAQVGSVGILSADRASFEILAMTGVPESTFRQWRQFPNTAGLPYPDVVATAEPIFITNRVDYEARFPALKETLGANPALAAAAVLPLSIDGRVMGGLSFDFIAPRDFDENDRALLTTLARQCAQAIERARLYDEARREHADADAARRRADEANQAKSAFLATMSHELRTPLNAISGYVELLAMGIRGPITDTQREDLTRIRRAGDYLLGLITDVLNFVQLEGATVSYVPRDVSVAEAMINASALIEPQARAKSVTFASAPCDPSHVVHADPDKVQQVILNLLSNAVKFTPAGGRVTLDCVLRPPRTIDIVVHDTGPGIPRDQIERIFEPFVQIGRELKNPTAGVGLGLAISRELARGMGGDLTAASGPGTGSTFTFTLPELQNA